MKFSAEWLRSFLSEPAQNFFLDGSGQKLEDTLLSLGLEVESKTHWTQALSGFRVGKVTTTQPHPDAQRLKVCTVRYLESGAARDVTLVCGADNVHPDILVILALPGTVIPATGETLQPSVIRGVPSTGMLCSFDELSVPSLNDQGGKSIAVLDATIPLDTPVCKALHLNDTFFQIEVTPNRPDLLGIDGLARELETAFRMRRDPKKPLGHTHQTVHQKSNISPSLIPNTPSEKAWKGASENRGRPASITVSISADAAPFCPEFALAEVQGPLNWAPLKKLRARLAMIDAGMAYWPEGHTSENTSADLSLNKNVKSVNAAPKKTNLATSGLVAVDITNYLVFQNARPLHAFDADLVAGDISVRLAAEGESFQALNGQAYVLQKNDIVVADNAGVLALAGVMGGVRAAVSDSTTRFYLESALFDSRCVSRTARRLGLVTDASLRFERGVDPESVLTGITAALDLMHRAGGHVIGIRHIHAPKAQESPLTPRTGLFDPDSFRKITGCALPRCSIVDTLESMGLSPQEHGAQKIDPIKVSIPRWRFDLLTEDNDSALRQTILNANLTEELLRFQGLDLVPSVSLPPKMASFSSLIKQPASEKTLGPALQTTSLTAKNAPAPLSYDLAQRARLFWAAQGLDEMITWSFIGENEAEAFRGQRPLIPLKNPVSSDMSCMRPSLIPGLLAMLGQHQKRFIDTNAGLFEVGTVYNAPKPHSETPMAACIISQRSDHWLGSKNQELWHLKALCENFLSSHGIQNSWILGENHTKSAGPPHPLKANTEGENRSSITFVSAPCPQDTLPFLHPGQSGLWCWHQKAPNLKDQGKKTASSEENSISLSTCLGYFGALHPRTLTLFDLKGPVWVAAFDLKALHACAAFCKQNNEKSAAHKNAWTAALAPYQRVQRDLGMVVPAHISAGQLMDLARQTLGGALASIAVFDTFHDAEKLGTEVKSIAFRLMLQPTSAPATESWLEEKSKAVLDLWQPLGCQLRRDVALSQAGPA